MATRRTESHDQTIDTGFITLDHKFERISAHKGWDDRSDPKNHPFESKSEWWHFQYTGDKPQEIFVDEMELIGVRQEALLTTKVKKGEKVVNFWSLKSTEEKPG